jgi:predicted NBD/HSP70 family sugar kinase
MEGNYLGHKEIILGLIKLAQIAVALQSPEYRDEKYNELRELVRRLEESDGGEYKSKEGENVEPLRFADIQKAIKMAEELKVKYKEVAKFEGFALSWAGAVLENRIVGRASIVAGLSDEGFKDKIVELGKKIAEEYGDVPYLVINDGEAAAIMAVMMGLKNVLGLAFGTSTGGGYFRF